MPQAELGRAFQHDVAVIEAPFGAVAAKDFEIFLEDFQAFQRGLFGIGAGGKVLFEGEGEGGDGVSALLHVAEEGVVYEIKEHRFIIAVVFEEGQMDGHAAVDAADVLFGQL